ncbi:GNAT family N-acetyltransferase [Lederbergia lenta]|uniref:Acetyltransferase n=1 Tax=Lederbergia lenta TaxID=1467 RepID=A0A2X4WJK7_LEDLE|nr:GNAT family N-acetyltransferase [Lederbergia lenta]MCM3109593.1 GNAT family N-acetyltransferase [Lederbergia lenta]MEC2324652.1 GNAT family N-acetyltransferase [Lederbergia lenta]SQI58902.1 acetyltransferase [Lederbergia lenta]
MEIRLLSQQDAEAYLTIRLLGLQNTPDSFASSYNEEKEQTATKYESRFQSRDSYTFGAFENNQLVGVVTLVTERLMKLKHRASIVSMYVSPDKRGIGIGKNLILAAIKKARDLKSVEQINLSVVTTNESAKNLYYSLGFKVFGIERKALKLGNTYWDEEHMVLFI